MKKKIFVIILVIFLLCGCSNKMPKPELSEGLRGELGIDKNINEETIDRYLGRDDTVYYDMRMLVDTAHYENIGGDSYLSGFIKGFEILPYPYLSEVVGLPESVGTPYQGKTLFRIENDKYIANYKESMEILEYFFPKDKYIFLMCGGGGYAGMTKNMLVALGWDSSKIYDIGGYWYYKGKNYISVKEEVNGEVNYQFWKLNYHDIDFDSLHEV